MSDDPMSQRDRRRQQHAANKPRINISASGLRQWAWPIAILVIVGGVVAIMASNNQAAQDCPTHWHSGYSFWLEDERVQFDNPIYTQHSESWAAGTHIHADDGLYHWHPTTAGTCNPYKDGLRNLGVQLSNDKLVLDDTHGATANHASYVGTYDTSDGATLRMFEQHWDKQDASWQEVTEFSKVLNKQPKNGYSMAVFWGHLSDQEIQDILATNAYVVKGNPSYDPYYESA